MEEELDKESQTFIPYLCLIGEIFFSTMKDIKNDKKNLPQP